MFYRSIFCIGVVMDEFAGYCLCMPKGIAVRGRVVKALREKMRVTQRTIANKTGLSNETIQRIESRDVISVMPENVAKLAAALGVDPTEIEAKPKR